jgi:hypothetical protein
MKDNKRESFIHSFKGTMRSKEDERKSDMPEALVATVPFISIFVAV